MLKRILLYPINRLIGLAAFPAQLAWRKELELPSSNTLSEYPDITWKTQLTDIDPNRPVYFSMYENKASLLTDSEKKYIIHAVGNGMCVQNYHEQYVQEAARWPQATIIAFNYPGVSGSPGAITQCQDAIDNGIIMVRWLEHNRKAKYKDIALVGHSIGGAVLAEVAKAMPEVTLFSDRTFSKLSLLAHNLFWLLALNLSILGSNLLIACAFGWMAGLAGLISSIAVVFKVGTTWFRDNVFLSLFAALFKHTIGDLNVTAAFQEIPDENRYAINAQDDPLIWPADSLLSSVLDPQQEYEQAKQFFYSPRNIIPSLLVFKGGNTRSELTPTTSHMADGKHLLNRLRLSQNAEQIYQEKIEAFLSLTPRPR